MPFKTRALPDFIAQGQQQEPCTYLHECWQLELSGGIHTLQLSFAHESQGHSTAPLLWRSICKNSAASSPQPSSTAGTQQQASGSSTQTSKRDASSKGRARTTAAAGTQQSRQLPTAIPALLIGDVFAPCNAIGLFKPHAELDEVFGQMGKTPGASAAQTSRRSHHTGTPQLPLSLPLTFEAGVRNLKAGQDKQGKGHDAFNTAKSSGRQRGAPSQPTSSTQPLLPDAGSGTIWPSSTVTALQDPGKESTASTVASPITAHPALVALDPSVQLLLRTVCTVKDKRLFFVSPRAADAIREAIVLQRHHEFQEERAAKRAAQLTPSPHTLPLDQIGSWINSMVDWLKPTPRSLNSPPTSTPATSTSIVTPDTSTADATTSASPITSPTSSTPSAIPTTTTPDDRFKGRRGLSKARGPSEATKHEKEADSLIKGPEQVIPLVAQLVEAATQLGPAFDWKALEERCVAAEVAHMRTGREGRPHQVEGPTSFVGRVPLQAALSLAAASPDQFRCMVTGTDTRLVHEARGRPAHLDTMTSTRERWVLKVADSDSDSDEDVDADANSVQGVVGSPTPVDTSSSVSDTAEGPVPVSVPVSNLKPAPRRVSQPPPKAGQPTTSLDDGEGTDEHDDEMALTSLTPVFQVPGVTLMLRTVSGQRVALTPAFLSVTQLNMFVEASKSLVRSMWLSGRKAKRAAFTRRLESAALALSGLSGSPGVMGIGGGASTASPAAQEADDDDEDGMGEPPEAKALLAELGEGRRPQGGAGGWAQGAGPLTGWAAAVSTLAVGVVSAVGHVTAAVGDGLDHMTANGPMALQSMGFPARIAVCADYLEPSLELIAKDNANRMDAWRLARRLKQAAKQAAAAVQAQVRLMQAQGGSPATKQGQVSGTDGAGAGIRVSGNGVSGTGVQGGGVVGQGTEQGTGSVAGPETTPTQGGVAATTSSGASINDSDGGLVQGQSKGDPHNPGAWQDNNVPTTSSSSSMSSHGPEAAPTAHPSTTTNTSTSTSTISNAASSDSPSASTNSSTSTSTSASPSAAERASMGPFKVKRLRVHGSKGSTSLTSSHAASQVSPQLESMAGVSMLSQAVWAVLHDAYNGDGQLASVLASSWASQAPLSTAVDGELSMMMTVQLKSSSQLTGGMEPDASSATPTPPSATPADGHGTTATGTHSVTGVSTLPGSTSDGGNAPQGSAGGVAVPKGPPALLPPGGARVSAGVSGDNSLAALLALSLPPNVAAEAHANKFEIGLHINTGKLTGKVPITAPDSCTLDQTCIRGLVLLGDLALENEDHHALTGTHTELRPAPTPALRAPPVGFADLAHVLAAYQKQQTAKQQQQEQQPPQNGQ